MDKEAVCPYCKDTNFYEDDTPPIIQCCNCLEVFAVLDNGETKIPTLIEFIRTVMQWSKAHGEDENKVFTRACAGWADGLRERYYNSIAEEPPVFYPATMTREEYLKLSDQYVTATGWLAERETRYKVSTGLTVAHDS